MKILHIIPAVFLFSMSASAQYNLQYNQVKMVGSSEETVPAGRVWKVESALISKKDGNAVTPSFRVVRSGVADTIYLGMDSYNISSWYDVNTVDVYIRKGPNVSCSYSSSINLRLLGSGSAGFIDQLFTHSFTAASLTTSFPLVPNASFTPPSPGNNSIDKWQLYSVLNFEGVEYRVVVNLKNGSKLSYIYNYSLTGNYCGSGWNYTYWHVGTSGSPPVDIARIDITRPSITTSFPLWLSAGTSLRSLKNIAYLSVIEFIETTP